MQPERIYLGMRVKTPDGEGRVVHFFDEDPDLLVCLKHGGGPRDLECRVKLDQGGEEKVYLVAMIVELRM